MKEYLSSKNIKFAYLDITDSMMNLKRFLKYRDNYKEFDEIKARGSIGIPCVVINDGERLVFDPTDLKLD